MESAPGQEWGWEAPAEVAPKPWDPGFPEGGLGWQCRAESETPGQEPAGQWKTLWLALHSVAGVARCPHRAGSGEKPIPHLHWWKVEISSYHTGLVAKESRHLTGGLAKPAGSFSPILPSPAVCWCKGPHRTHQRVPAPAEPLPTLLHLQPLNLCFPAPSPSSDKCPLIPSSHSKRGPALWKSCEQMFSLIVLSDISFLTPLPHLLLLLYSLT